jgi:hypothetical protein
MKDLVVKITKAALEVGGSLKADKRNQEQRYDYLSADKILSICGQALFTQGVVIIPELTSQKVDCIDRGNSKYRFDSEVNFIFTVTDGETEIKSPWVGMGSDYSTPDKALYKGYTSGHKYFLMKLLCIGEGNEDSEHETEEEQTRSKSAAKTNGNGNGNKPAAPAETKTAPPATNGKIERPYPGDILKTGLNAKAEKLTDKAQPHHKQSVAAALNCYLKDENDKSGETHRHMLMYYLFGVNSMDELSDGQILALHGWLKPEYDKAAKAFSITDPHAKAEIELAGERMTEEMNGVTENG